MSVANKKNMATISAISAILGAIVVVVLILRLASKTRIDEIYERVFED